MDTITRRQLLGRLTTASAISAGLAGCVSLPGFGGGTSNELVTNSRIGPSDASTKLDLWAQQGLSNHADVKAAAKAYENAYQDWAKAHTKEDVMFDLNVITNYGQMQNKLLQVAGSPSAPSVATIDSFWAPNYYDDLLSIDNEVGDESDYFEYVKREMTHNGSWKAGWYQTDCRALFYRKDLINKYGDGKPPRTWDELIQVGKDITKNENMNGYMYNGGRWEATCFDNLAYYWGQGGRIVDENRDPVFDTEKNRQRLYDTFEFINRTIETGITPQRVANIKDYNLLHKAGFNGQTAMFLGGSFQLASMRANYPEDQVNNWFVSEIPMQKKDQLATGAGGWTHGVYHAPKKARTAATEFVGTFLEPQHMGKITKAAGALPTRKSVYDQFEYFSEDKWFQVFLQLLREGGQARPGGNVYSVFSNQWQIAVGEIVTGQEEPRKAVDQLIENTLANIS